MYIKRICYPVRTLGPGARIGIWTTGCARNCPGCISPELQDLRAGRDIPVERILTMMRRVNGEISGVTISGGEPFDQPEELCALVCAVESEFTRDLIVYTGYRLEELRERRDPAVDRTLEHISVLIDGPYVDALNDGIGLRGSSNQRIHVFRDAERYRGMETAPRKVQSFSYDGQIVLVGIQ